MDFSTVRVQVAVPEVEASLIAKGQPVKIAPEGVSGPPVTAQVTRFSYALDDATKTMLVEIETPNPKRLLRPGMYANVKVGLERKRTLFLSPWKRYSWKRPMLLSSSRLTAKPKKLPSRSVSMTASTLRSFPDSSPINQSFSSENRPWSPTSRFA